MARTISGSVGQGGINRPVDAATVQELLNNVAPHEGGPLPPLKVDGLAWTKTIAAIRQFQKVQLGFKWPDGRVDPQGKTMARLNELEDSAVPAVQLPPGPVWLI